VNALASLRVDALLSYAIAIVLPALDAILPLLPSETAVITLGVATAGSTDPRIGLLVACSAAGAFLGDNLCYLLGRRFGPRIERRFFRGEKGARRLAWAERSLERYGMPLIVVCRFIPGGRTAVTLCCGIVRYQQRRFVIATAIAGVIWASYSFFIGRLGGKAFEDKPWAGLLLAFGATLTVSAVIEGIRRWRSSRSSRPGRSRRRHAGQVEADDPGEDQAHRHQLQGGHRVAEEDHAHGGGADGADPGPHRVRGTHLELAQRHVQQREAQQRADGEDDGRPQPGHPMA
jgi:membrane protein DedA with SNARE-associated domain